jgi:hypothetical protein
VFLLFVLTEMYSLSKMKSTFVRERTNNLLVIQDKHYDVSVFFWLCTSHFDHDMFLLFFDGRNDR